MKGICKLYKIECDLKESHIFPKFIIDYFKSTGSPFMRNFNSPNRRMQDGIKKYYLSDQAEQEFSKREKWFAENIFKDYQENKKKSFQYDENLYYFLISLLWRGLHTELELSDTSQLSYYSLLLKVEEEWRNFLIDQKTPTTFNDVNLFLTDNIKSHNINATGLDYYFTRTFDIATLADPTGSCIFMYCKFMKFIVWATIKDIHPNINKDLIISPQKGSIHFPQNVADGYILEGLIQRVKEIESLPQPSARQLAKIEQDVLKNPDVIYKSDAGKSILNDLQNLDKKF